MRTAIEIDELGKSYRLGERSVGYKTLRESLASVGRRRTRPGRELHVADSTLWALRGLSLNVPEGEVLGVIGPNGAGKSTLLKILSRITEPTEGRVRMSGRVGSLLEVGTGFHPELTGRENIFLNGAVLGMGRSEVARQFEDIVAFAEVEKFIDTPVKRFSSGMYLRLAFSVAAHMQTEVLLVDEVLAVGDASFQRRCLEKMQEVGQGGRTVVFVSHDMSAMANLVGRAVYLDGGKPVCSGAPDAVIGKYLQRSTGTRMDLNQRADRRGDGVIRILSIACLDEREQAVVSIKSGDAVKILMDYRSDIVAFEMAELALDIRFRDPLGRPVVTFSTRFGEASRSSSVPGNGSFVLSIPSLPLVGDVYSIDIWLAFRGGLADELLTAAHLSVDSVDAYGTGQIPVPRKHGSLILSHRWDVKDAGSN